LRGHEKIVNTFRGQQASRSCQLPLDRWRRGPGGWHRGDARPQPARRQACRRRHRGRTGGL